MLIYFKRSYVYENLLGLNQYELDIDYLTPIFALQRIDWYMGELVEAVYPHDYSHDPAWHNRGQKYIPVDATSQQAFRFHKWGELTDFKIFDNGTERRSHFQKALFRPVQKAQSLKVLLHNDLIVYTAPCETGEGCCWKSVF